MVAWLAAFVALMCPHPAASADNDQVLVEVLARLTIGNFEDKSEAIADLELLVDSRTPALLQAMLDGDLYYRKSARARTTSE